MLTTPPGNIPSPNSKDQLLSHFCHHPVPISAPISIHSPSNFRKTNPPKQKASPQGSSKLRTSPRSKQGVHSVHRKVDSRMFSLLLLRLLLLRLTYWFPEARAASTHADTSRAPKVLRSLRDALPIYIHVPGSDCEVGCRERVVGVVWPISRAVTDVRGGMFRRVEEDEFRAWAGWFFD